MELSEENIKNFIKTLINIIEEKENVKIIYKIKKNSPKNGEKTKSA